MKDQIDDLALLELLESADAAPAQLRSADIWAADAFARAWEAAAAEFGSSIDGVPADVPREEQLLASPLWYAPKAQASTTTNAAVKRKRSPATAVVEEVVAKNAPTEEAEETFEPYLDLADYEPVPPTTLYAPLDNESTLNIPSPPSPESASAPPSTYAQSQTQQEALQTALEGWYAAGYATALHHVRSGLVQL